jgi:Uma2 family endonuclease
MITDISQLNFDKIYSYRDYLSWRFTERVELIRGKIFKMTPMPSLTHQQVSAALFGEIRNFLKNKPCQVFHPPFDVRLPKKGENEVYTVVQPDITIVCDENKLDERGCLGAPDFVIEITSPSSANKDLHEKYEMYEEAGVKEYWVVFPMEGTISVFLLNENSKYTPIKPYTFVDNLESRAIPGMAISLTEIFPKKLQEPEEPYGENVRRI